MSAFTKSMALKKPSSNAAPLRATFLHTVQTSIRSNNSLQNSKLSFARLRHTVSKKQPSRLTVSARPSPTASAKSCQQNAPHISQIQGMVNLNGKRSNWGVAEDSVFKRDWPKLRDAGIVRGAYLFLRFPPPIAKYNEKRVPDP